MKTLQTRMRMLVETIPNKVTLVRLVLIPILWIFFFFRMPVFIGIGLIFAYATDKLDGLLARLLNQKSQFGDKMDSFADHLLLPSVVVWLVILRPSVYTDNRILGIGAACIYLATIVIGLIRSRRFGGAHLLFAKLLGLVGYTFAADALLDGPSRILYYMAIVLVILFSMETSVYHFRKDLFENRLHSIVLGLLNRDVKARFIKYLL
jgi:phosphatidylglycerophosphate synthase